MLSRRLQGFVKFFEEGLQLLNYLNRKEIVFYLAFLVGGGVSKVAAQGVSPYLPLNSSPELERQVERLMALSGETVLTRPIPLTRVKRAVDTYCTQSSLLCRQVKAYLDKSSKSDGVSYFNIEAYASSELQRDSSLANQRGEEIENSFQVSGQVYLNLGLNAQVHFGGERREDGESLTGTYGSYGASWMQLDVGYRPIWLSPFQSSAMVFSTNAEESLSVSLSNPLPWEFLGFTYHLFLTEASESSRILYGNGFTTGKPCIGGVHLGFRPSDSVAFGVNRVAQFGGGARGKCYEPKNALDAFFNPSQADNRGEGESKDDEFGNQLASITASVNFSGAKPFLIYFEAAGEDTSDNKAYQFGNVAMQLGLKIPELTLGTDLTLEVSEWQNSWYVSGIYQDGFRSKGNVLGHWAGDQRMLGDAVGGRALALYVNAQIKQNKLLMTRFRILNQEEYFGQDYDEALDLSLSYSVGLKRHIVGVESLFGTTVWGEEFYRVGAFLRW